MEKATGVLYPYLLEYPNHDRNGLFQGPCWRAIVQSDLGLQRSVRNFPPEFVEELLEHNRVGRVCQERGNWEDAEMEFLLSKAKLLSIAGREHIEKQTYDSLLAWAVLPLAQLYQSWGGADKLFAALEVWTEILGRVRSSDGSDLVLLCDTYVCTAQYEWGRCESSADAKGDAVKRYAELMHCTDDEAEAQLCILLGVDHECLGKFEPSLRWFQEGNRMWKRLYSDAGEFGPKYRCGLGLEAQLLMRLGNVDAFKVLLASSPDISDPINSKNIFEKLALEDLMQVMTSAAAMGLFKIANRSKELARRIHGLQLCERRPCMICFSEEALISDISKLSDWYHPENILQYHPILTPTPSPIGSLLGLLPGAHDPPGFNFYVNAVDKLPFAIMLILKSLDLKHNIHLEGVVELVKICEKFLDRKTYHRLLSLFALPLAFRYQYNSREFGLAMKIWVELIDNCDMRVTEPDYMELTAFGCKTMLYALQFEAMDEGKHLVLPNITSLINFASPRTSREKLKLDRDSCFWLYFGHYKAENWELALKWVRRAKKLEDEHAASCSDNLYPSKHSASLADEVHDYFSCDYDYMLCEAELLMKLQEYDDAHQMLERVLQTEHVRRGSPVVATQARVWMAECVNKMYTTGSKTADAEARLKMLSARTSSDISNQREFCREEIQRQSPLPTPTGCVLVLEDEFPKLIQSQVGLEHHLYKLPNPYRLAFRYHGSRGRLLSAGDGVGEDAIFEFEWCRGVLKMLPGEYPKASPEIKRACEWLMVWASIPLANIYEFKKMQFEVAFRLRMEAFQNFPEDETRPIVEDYSILRRSLGFKMKSVVNAIFYYGLYKKSRQKYLDLKNLIVRAVGLRSGLGDPGVEYCLWTFFAEAFYDFSNYEAAIRCARLANEHLFDPQQLEDTSKEFAMKLVLIEFLSFFKLRRSHDARMVLERYRNCNHLTDEELPELIRCGFLLSDQMRLSDLQRVLRIPEPMLYGFLLSDEMTVSGVASEDHVKKISEVLIADGDKDYKDYAQLKVDEAYYWRTKEFVKGIEDFEKRLAKFVGQESRIMEECLNDVLLGFHLQLVYNKISASDSFWVGNIDEAKAFYQDVNLQNAVKHMEEINHLQSIPEPFHLKGRGLNKRNFQMMELYGILDRGYFVALKPFKLQIYNDMHEFRELYGHFPEAEAVWLMGNNSLAFMEIETFLNKTPRMIEFGNKAIEQFVNIVDTMGVTKQYTEYWIEWLEWNQLLYTLFQQHYYFQADCYALMKLKASNDEARREILEEEEKCNYKAFVYAEIERAQVMTYQLQAHELNYQSISYQQWSFDWHLNVSGQDHHELVKTIRENSCSLLQGDSIFVMYSPFDQYDTFRIYVLDQQGALTSRISKVERTKDGRSFQKLLMELYNYLGETNSRGSNKKKNSCRSNKKKRQKYNDDSANKDLEFLHDVLIGPIARHLGKMKPEQKLILCPSQLLAKVPFAALRDCNGKYLIERHTIAQTSSLRMLHFCRERLMRLRSELQGPASHLRYGSIVALGNPKYNDCENCRKTLNNRQELSGTGQEVTNITKLFEKTIPVVKLLEEQATVDNLLQWAAKPSQDRSLQQAIVHIGAHGVAKIENHRESVLQLACPLRTSNGTDVASTSHESIRSNVASTSRPTVGSHVSMNQQRYWEPGLRGVQLLDGELDSHDDSSDESDIDDDGNDVVAKMIFNETTSLYDHPGQLMSKLSTFGSFSNEFEASCSRDGHLSRSDAPCSDGSLHDLSVDNLIRSKTLWRAELVVLSACQTASGRVTTEGVLSLARAFIVAGVPSVVASLWKVDDEGTVPLMKAFYRRLRRGVDVATALRFAMLHCMKKSREIRLWAPFNVWGDPFLQIPEDLHYSADNKFEHIDDSDEDEGVQQAIKDATGATHDKGKAKVLGGNVNNQAGSSTSACDGEGGSGFVAAVTAGGGEVHKFSKEQVEKCSSKPNITMPDAHSMDIIDNEDDTSLLEQALAMSMADGVCSGPAASDISVAESDEYNQDLACALRMSMEESSVDVDQAVGDESFISSVLSSNQDQAGKEKNK